jgi:hypothetical protein
MYSQVMRKDKKKSKSKSKRSAAAQPVQDKTEQKNNMNK